MHKAFPCNCPSCASDEVITWMDDECYVACVSGWALNYVVVFECQQCGAAWTLDDEVFNLAYQQGERRAIALKKANDSILANKRPTLVLSEYNKFAMERGWS
jgi:hypothetical protein